MITLGIESSCDETSVAIVGSKNKVLSNVVYSSLKEHSRFGGVVPEIASRSHLESILQCLHAALAQAKVSLKDVDLIAVTQGPGLLGSLLVGLSAAKALSASLKKPLLGVDHVIAHIYAGLLAKKRVVWPCLGLVVSGGHTLLLKIQAPNRITILGNTLDDAAGEAFDKVAKILGLRYPGGPEVDRLSRGQDPNRIFFTRPFLSKDSLNFSFSGIKTAVFHKAEEIRKKKPLSLKVKQEICAGFQEAVCDVLVQKSFFAAKTHKLNTLVVGGGVSANHRLKEKFSQASKKEGIRVVFPPSWLCQDNAAMIAAYGAALYRCGQRDSLALSSYPDFLHKKNTLQ